MFQGFPRKEQRPHETRCGNGIEKQQVSFCQRAGLPLPSGSLQMGSSESFIQGHVCFQASWPRVEKIKYEFA